MDYSETTNILDIDDSDLEEISPFDIDWGIDLPKQDDYVQDEKKYSAVNEDDYTDEQLDVLKIIKRKIADACNVKITAKKSKKAIEWCFNLDKKDKNGLDFKTACLALGARPEVILARIHHRLYENSIVRGSPIDGFWLAKLPEQYVSESIMAAWEDGLKVVEFIWEWPGVPMEILEAKVDIKNFNETIDKLEKTGLIAWSFGAVFLTGRSEKTMASRNFSWSKSFF